MSSNPTSHFVFLPNRPIVVQENGDTVRDKLKLHYWEWKGHQPTILFCHGVSFHGRCYDRIINEALNGYHVISIDLRGHGRSQQHPPPYDSRWIGEDILSFIETLHLSNDHLIGIGHSFGGYALTYAALIAPRRLFQSLLLLDPGILARDLYGLGDNKIPELTYILRRKNHWNSVDEMISRLEIRPPFKNWPKDIIRTYCTYALNENHELTCNSDIEYSIYHSTLHTNSNMYPLFEKSKFIHDIPIHIVRSSIPFVLGQFDTSPTSPELVRYLRKGRETRLDNAKHFFPMEEIQLTVDLIKQILKDNFRSNL